ncbi:hypothetical protein D3C86_1843340 [compost metagenome]
MRQYPCGLDSARIVTETYGHLLAEDRPAVKLDPRLGNDAQCAFGAEEKSIRIGSRTRYRETSGFNGTLGRYHSHALDVVVDLSERRCKVACCPCCDPTPQ